jgi:hypothetical protein
LDWLGKTSEVNANVETNFRSKNMYTPLIVSIPHRLGKAEAVRRLQAGLSNMRAIFAQHLSNIEERWVEGRLDFRFDALDETARGTVDVAEDYVRLEVRLPPALAAFAADNMGVIERQGRLLLGTG